MKLEINYNNDVGPNDDGFWEWWEVSNGETSFSCRTEEDAIWLINVFNTHNISRINC